MPAGDNIHDYKEELAMKPVLFKVQVKALSDICSADHIMINKQHYLVKSVDADSVTFSAYTVEPSKLSKTNSVTLKQNQPWKSCDSPEVYRIEYSIPGGRLCEASNALEKAEVERRIGSKWKCSEGFLTKIKCNKEYFFDDDCIMKDDVKIESYTHVTPQISIDAGDHLILVDKKNSAKYRSVLVCKCIDLSIAEIIPSVSHSDSSTGIDVCLEQDVNLANYVVYRVNYSHTLPSDDVMQRAKSVFGKEVLIHNGIDGSDRFISWTKTGRELSVSKLELLGNKPTIAERCPLRYNKIMSPDEIKVGDHLFTRKILDYIVNDFKVQHTHYLVTEEVKDTVNPIFKVICFSVGTLKEVECDCNSLIDKGAYRIVYPEEFPNYLSIKRARSLVGKTFLLTCASTILRWVKTGSEKGLEVDFLINSSAPTSKSHIICFTQLNPGDYLIKQASDSESLLKKALSFDHHYIVVSIESPMECTVIESWRRKIEKKSLVCENLSGESSYFRINYDPGQCLQAELSIEIAENAISNPKLLSRYWKPTSDYARKSFIHFIKTGEKSVNIQSLLDDRLFLQRELVTSALDLRVGDHIERPLSLAPEHAQHHMLFVEPLDHSICKVIHFKVEKSTKRILQFKKGDVVSEEVDIFITGDVFRIVYPERTDPRNGIEKLVRICEGDKNTLLTELGKVSFIILYIKQ